MARRWRNRVQLRYIELGMGVGGSVDERSAGVLPERQESQQGESY